jgi:ABC-2 type transport system permease protein
MIASLVSWRALLVREYREHRVAFLYVPAGILVVLALASAASLAGSHTRLFLAAVAPDSLKLFEFGALLIFALWFAYLVVTLFFYFGDAFSADRRNNAMFFWKSMPVSDLKILSSKFLAGVTIFPALVFVVAVIAALAFLVVIEIGETVIGLTPAAPFALLQSLGQICVFAIVNLVLSLFWYAPFMAWVGGLSTVFGRWSLPLAFVIPGLASVIENIVFFGQGPRGGYIWGYLGQRWQFGLDGGDFSRMLMTDAPFDAATFISAVWARIDWWSMGGGLVFAVVVTWLASEYRRRRIV